MKAVELCQLSGAGGGGDPKFGGTKFGGNIGISCEQSVSVSGRNVSGKIRNAQRGKEANYHHLTFSERQIVLKFNHFKHYVNKYVEKTHQVLRDTK